MLADAVVVVHGAIAAFIALGFIVIPLGAWRRWEFVRRRVWRGLHLGGICFVAAEALLGVACPLTVWEDLLRGAAPDEAGFIARGVRALLYYNVPLWVFSVIYLAAAIVALAFWCWIPPQPRKR